jgi:hypothetical protein
MGRSNDVLNRISWLWGRSYTVEVCHQIISFAYFRGLKKDSFAKVTNLSHWYIFSCKWTARINNTEGKGKVGLCVTNWALCHEGAWESGHTDPHFLDLCTNWRWVVSSCPGHFTPGERAPFMNWIGRWVGPRASLDDMEKRKFLLISCNIYKAFW